MLNSLNIAQTALEASKLGIENIQNNIANKDTPGYKKRVLVQSELESFGSTYGRGVRVDSVRRITFFYMSKNLLQENSKVSYYLQRDALLGNIESIFKETSNMGLSKDLNNYLQAIENLRTDPNSQIYKSHLRTNANVLVKNMKNLYENIEKNELLVRNQMTKDVDKVNFLLQKIGEVNEQLGKTKVVLNNLLDEREQLEQELSKYVNITSQDVKGTYTLTIGDVVAIGNNTVVRNISVKDNYITQKDRFLNNDGETSSLLNGVTFDNEDKITYKLNNTDEVSVRFGEGIDTNKDGVADFKVDKTNYIRALVSKINNDPQLSKAIVAYNGTYMEDNNGNKITNNKKDNFLLIESTVAGEKGKFSGRVLVTEQTDETNPSTISNKKVVFRDEYQSNNGENSIQIYASDAPIQLNSGSLKAQFENLTTNSQNNKFTIYKNKLDALARTLSDITDKFVKIDDKTYVSGEISTDEYKKDQRNIVSIGLFSGGNVKTLKFNENKVDNLDQMKLDYLASLQWKSNISFEGKGQSNLGSKSTSLSEYFQEVRVGVSSDKKDNDSLLTTQQAIKQSIKSSYDKVVKVDTDEETLNLLRYKSAYDASAKIITIADSMIKTILAIR